ncbi:MAG: RES family NAD+ phosphorylase [Legionellaceae bacterium]|nr:RES family NAD+ phosphorylase [Legionellaceae bacterium]
MGCRQSVKRRTRRTGLVENVPPLRNFNAQKNYRIIPSRFPPLDLFEDVASEEEFAAIFQIQCLTNPRLQNEIGDISLVKPHERAYGIPGCGYVMAAFTHLNPDGSRFSNGDYGVYYCSETLETAISETRFHRARFLSYTREPAQELDMRCLVARFNGTLYDLLPIAKHHEYYDPLNYQHGQKLGMELKIQEQDGIVYHSVRQEQGINFALFKPNLIQHCQQSLHLCYVWNGHEISDIYQKKLL